MKDYKPLMHLSGDEESCRKIFDFICNNESAIYSSICIDNDFYFLDINGKIGSNDVQVVIWSDGDIFFELGAKDELIPNIFDVVDFIRSLGYSKV